MGMVSFYYVIVNQRKKIKIIDPGGIKLMCKKTIRAWFGHRKSALECEVELCNYIIESETLSKSEMTMTTIAYKPFEPDENNKYKKYTCRILICGEGVDVLKTLLTHFSNLVEELNPLTDNWDIIPS